jgi:hypothetical protein
MEQSDQQSADRDPEIPAAAVKSNRRMALNPDIWRKPRRQAGKPF